MRVKKGKVPYGEAYEHSKKLRDEATRLKREKEEKALHQSYSIDEDFNASLGAMIGTTIANNNDISACDTTTSCDINDSFNLDI